MFPTARTDRHNNPTAFTTALAYQAGLKLDVDYYQGDKFPGNVKLYTAGLLGDPIDLTIRVIDKVTYYTHSRTPRWDYIAIPTFLWDTLTREQRIDVIGFHYMHEGGQTLKKLFPHWGKL
jgi:hypothetical protein